MDSINYICESRSYGLAPGGSIGNLVTSVLALPANLLLVVAYALHDFGS